MSTVRSDSWYAVCDCANYYGPRFDTEVEARKFIAEYPKCSECDGTEES